MRVLLGQHQPSIGTYGFIQAMSHSAVPRTAVGGRAGPLTEAAPWERCRMISIRSRGPGSRKARDHALVIDTASAMTQRLDTAGRRSGGEHGRHP